MQPRLRGCLANALVGMYIILLYYNTYMLDGCIGLKLSSQLF